MSQSDKKHRKEVKRRQKLKERLRNSESEALRKRRADQSARWAGQYPEIVFEGKAAPEFELAIRNAAKSISFDSPVFSDWERQVYRSIKSHGAAAAISDLQSTENDLSRQGRGLPLVPLFMCGLGHQVFQVVGITQLEPMLLVNDIYFEPHGNQICGKFRQLCVERGSGGKVYYSPQEPKVVFGGQELIAAFSRHAMESICDRVMPSWRTYAGHGDVFFFFHDCTHFSAEPCACPSDVLNGFAMYQQMVGPLSPVYISALEGALMGLESPDDSGLFANIGYCPVVIEGKFAKAKTYLPPGFSKTREYACFSDARIPAELRHSMKQLATADNPGSGKLHSDPEVLRFFHVNGYPQVFKGSDPRFSHISKDE